MAYIINKTDGSIFANIADGTLNTDSSVSLPGRNYTGYGELHAENFIRLLESGSNLSAPSNPLSGQLWYDKTVDTLKVYNGTAFRVLGVTTSGSPPSTLIAGDLWFDTLNSQLNVYNGTDFTLIGPDYSSLTGVSGAIVETVSDGATDHIVTKLYVAGDLVGIVSKQAEFTPNPVVPGFTTIKPGIQLSTSVNGQTPVFEGTSTNAELLNGVDNTAFLSSSANDTTTGSLGIINDLGLTIGADSDGRFTVSGDNVTLSNATVDGDLIIQVNDGGVDTPVITCDGATARAQVDAPLSGSDIVNRDYLDLTLSSTLVSDLTFAIPSPVADSKGIVWTGNTDYAKIFVESYGGPDSSRLVLEIGDNATDYISFKSNATEILKVASTGIDCITNDITNVGQIDVVTIVLPNAAAISEDTIILDGTTINDPVTIKNNDLINIRLESLLSPASKEIGFDVGGTGEAGKFIDGDGDGNRLDMLGNKITNVADPVDLQDAATQQYVLGVATISAPTGTIVPFAGSVAPTGWLVCNGVSLPKAGLYNPLFLVIGITYGDAGSAYNIPDLRGNFVRGFDDGAGVDYARVFGSLQLDEFKSHSHLNYRLGWNENADNGGSQGNYLKHNYGTQDSPTSDTGGDETRPRNVAMHYIIKY